MKFGEITMLLLFHNLVNNKKTNGASMIPSARFTASPASSDHYPHLTFIWFCEILKSGDEWMWSLWVGLVDQQFFRLEFHHFAMWIFLARLLISWKENGCFPLFIPPRAYLLNSLSFLSSSAEFDPPGPGCIGGHYFSHMVVHQSVPWQNQKRHWNKTASYKVTRKWGLVGHSLFYSLFFTFYLLDFGPAKVLWPKTWI